MADDTPVAAPAEAVEQPERDAAAAGDKPADQESENVITTEDKQNDTTSANDEKKDAEAGTDQAQDSGDATETKDETAAAAGDAEAAAPEANGTPASSKKSSKDRRRSTGAAEKSKLNKRKSMSKITQLNVQPGEYYLARLRSYAPWPSIICDEEMLPQSLLDTRPVTAAQPDGTYRADYADGGKRAHERTFPVMFFQSNEFAWIPNTQLTPITAAECKNVSEKNKAKGLIEAYKVAAEGHDLAYFKQMLADHEAAIQQEIEEEEAAEAAKAAAKAEKEAAKEAAKEAKKAASKSKRKSKGADTDVEMEDVEDSKKAKTSKKRKNETDGDAEKPAKTPKTSTKLKLTTPKAPAEEKKTPASKAKKPSSKKAKASDEDSAAEAKEPEKQVDPEELKKKKEKEILFLRHKLQKGFISREMPPKEDEMATMATYFDKLEKHADLEVSIIRTTKINKVLKMIVKLDTIPRDEEFQFRHRAMGILTSWKSVLETDAPAPSDKDAKPTANGAHKDDDAADTPKVETEEEKELESKATNDDTPMPDAEKAKSEDAGESEPKGTAEDKQAEEKTVEAAA